MQPPKCHRFPPEPRNAEPTHIYTDPKRRSYLQPPLLTNLLKTLHQIPDLETLPPLKRHAAFRAFAHLLYVFLHVLEGGDGACIGS